MKEEVFSSEFGILREERFRRCYCADGHNVDSAKTICRYPHTLNMVSLLFCMCLMLINACKHDDAVNEDDTVLESSVSVVSNYIDSIGMLESLPIVDIREDTISRTEGSAVLLQYPYVQNNDYYIPVTLEKYKSGNVKTGNNVSFQTSDVIWPGNLVQGISVNDHQLASVPLSKYRNPGIIYLDVVSG